MGWSTIGVWWRDHLHVNRHHQDHQGYFLVVKSHIGIVDGGVKDGVYNTACKCAWFYGICAMDFEIVFSLKTHILWWISGFWHDLIFKFEGTMRRRKLRKAGLKLLANSRSQLAQLANSTQSCTYYTSFYFWEPGTNPLFNGSWSHRLLEQLVILLIIDSNVCLTFFLMRMTHHQLQHPCISLFTGSL